MFGKIIQKIIDNIFWAIKADSSFFVQLKIFFMLTRLLFKSKLYGQSNKKSYEYFFNYKVVGYSYYSLHFLFKEIFSEKEYYFETDTNNPIIVDCGANIGISLLYFKKLFKDSKVICFEANKHTFDLLNENIKNNNLTNVETHNIALSDTSGEVSFFISENIGTLVGSLDSSRGGDVEIKCKAEKLSKFIKNLDKIHLMKIDVEGAEWLILKDLIETGLINKVDQYIIEYHHRINDEKSKLSEFLIFFEKNGFDYNIKTNYLKKGSFQDILIHFYKDK